MNHQHNLSKNCRHCGKVFCKPYYTGMPEWKQRKYCSNACINVGRRAWNKGKKKWWKSSGDFKKGHRSWNKGKVSHVLGELHPMWKGEKVSMTGLHNWVRRNLGSPPKCEFCGFESTNNRKIHWANKSGKYKRDLKDFIRLCVSCHKKYDLNRKAL